MDSCNYRGSPEHLLFENTESYDRRVETAIEEAIRLCGDILNDDTSGNNVEMRKIVLEMNRW